jgi:hypothetical protein
MKVASIVLAVRHMTEKTILKLDITTLQTRLLRANLDRSGDALGSRDCVGRWRGEMVSQDSADTGTANTRGSDTQHAWACATSCCGKGQTSQAARSASTKVTGGRRGEGHCWCLDSGIVSFLLHPAGGQCFHHDDPPTPSPPTAGRTKGAVRRRERGVSSRQT